MDSDYEKIYSEFRKLIVESCAFNEMPSKDFQSFHHDFLKFFFAVMEVKVDYLTKTIALWSPKPISNEPLTSYNINTSTTGTVSYVDLEATLLGCIEKGQFQARFYKHLLHDYGQLGSKHDEDYGSGGLLKSVN